MHCTVNVFLKGETCGYRRWTGVFHSCVCVQTLTLGGEQAVNSGMLDELF